jgi:hypothetical protein
LLNNLLSDIYDRAEPTIELDSSIKASIISRAEMPDSDEDDDDYREYDEGEEAEAFLEDFDDLAIGSRRKIFGENGDDRFDDDEEDAARSGPVTPQDVRFLSLFKTRSHPLLISSNYIETGSYAIVVTSVRIAGTSCFITSHIDLFSFRCIV